MKTRDLIRKELGLGPQDTVEYTMHPGYQYRQWVVTRFGQSPQVIDVRMLRLSVQQTEGAMRRGGK